MISNEKEIPLAKCREILEEESSLYSDEEVLKLRDVLSKIAEVIVKQLENKNNVMV